MPEGHNVGEAKEMQCKQTPKGFADTTKRDAPYALPKGASAYCTFRCWNGGQYMPKGAKLILWAPSGVTKKPFGHIFMRSPKGRAHTAPLGAGGSPHRDPAKWAPKGPKGWSLPLRGKSNILPIGAPSLYRLRRSSLRERATSKAQYMPKGLKAKGISFPLRGT